MMYNGNRSSREEMTVCTIDLLNTRPVIPLNSFSQFDFLLVKGDIYRTRQQSMYNRVHSEKPSSDIKKYGGDPRQAYSRKVRVKVIAKIDCQI